jgi:hypothetical protein
MKNSTQIVNISYVSFQLNVISRTHASHNLGRMENSMNRKKAQENWVGKIIFISTTAIKSPLTFWKIFDKGPKLYEIY